MRWRHTRTIRYTVLVRFYLMVWRHSCCNGVCVGLRSGWALTAHFLAGWNVILLWYSQRCATFRPPFLLLFVGGWHRFWTSRASVKRFSTYVRYFAVFLSYLSFLFLFLLFSSSVGFGTWTVFSDVSYLATNPTVAVCWSFVTIGQEVHVKEKPLAELRGYVVPWKSKSFTPSNEGTHDVAGHLSCHTCTQVMIQVKGICKISYIRT